MITQNAEALEAQYAGRSQSRPIGEPPPLYAPSMNIPPNKQGQIPLGEPIPEGVIIQRPVGRGIPAPSMAVVPPQVNQGPQPQMMVVPPTGLGRTTIGTFVENRAPVSPTTSNPMVRAEAMAPLPVEAPEPLPPKQPRKKLDLTLAILDHMQELGGHMSEACQQFYDKSEASLRRYLTDPGAIPLSCVVKFMDKKPGVMVRIQDQLEPHFAANGDGGTWSLPNRGRTDMMLCSPILERPTLPYLFLVGHLMKKYEMGWNIQADTMIARSRNMLAKRFLESNAKWSLWVDGDMAAPIGRPDWYKSVTMPTTITEETAGYEVVDRMLGQGKAIIGAVYASRRYHGQLVIQPEIHPRSHEDRLLCNDIRKGTARGLVDVDWVGFGCAMVHREVFLEIQRKFPQLAPQAEQAPWRFFQTEGDEGEDEAFCKRAKACGIPIWLDTQLICGHIGSMAFMPEHTLPRPGI